MGSCQGAAVPLAPKNLKQVSVRIDRQVEKAQIEARNLQRLLLLGAGESGKSTLFKQSKALFGKPFSKKEREDLVLIIRSNVLEGIATLLEQAELRGITNAEIIQLKEEMIQDRNRDGVSTELVVSVKRFWALEEIKKLFECRAEFQLQDSLGFFLDRIEQVSALDYDPPLDHILRSRSKTTGVVEMEVALKGQRVALIDVGGQRNERRKWIHQFSVCSAVIFVASMAEYDQVLIEDQRTNRLLEALDLFSAVCHIKTFDGKPLILFLNKRDLFFEKLKKVPLNSLFDSYVPTLTYPVEATVSEKEAIKEFQQASEFLVDRFRKCDRSQSRSIYCHVTCATDSENIKHVFLDLVDVIIRNFLMESGF